MKKMSTWKTAQSTDKQLPYVLKFSILDLHGSLIFWFPHLNDHSSQRWFSSNNVLRYSPLRTLPFFHFFSDWTHFSWIVSLSWAQDSQISSSVQTLLLRGTSISPLTLPPQVVLSTGTQHAYHWSVILPLNLLLLYHWSCECHLFLLCYLRKKSRNHINFLLNPQPHWMRPKYCVISFSWISFHSILFYSFSLHSLGSRWFQLPLAKLLFFQLIHFQFISHTITTIY
jgi:hypothetical protein